MKCTNLDVLKHSVKSCAKLNYSLNRCKRLIKRAIKSNLLARNVRTQLNDAVVEARHTLIAEVQVIAPPVCPLEMDKHCLSVTHPQCQSHRHKTNSVCQ